MTGVSFSLRVISAVVVKPRLNERREAFCILKRFFLIEFPPPLGDGSPSPSLPSVWSSRDTISILQNIIVAVLRYRNTLQHQSITVTTFSVVRAFQARGAVASIVALPQQGNVAHDSAVFFLCYDTERKH